MIQSGAETGSLAQTVPLDVQEYIAERNARENFVMVEIGHGALPVAYQQLSFRGQRAYVGVEAWLRDPHSQARQHLADLEARYPDQNATFINMKFEAKLSDYLSGLMGKGGRGDPAPATILPDGAADEVFLSNVFGDPRVARSSQRTKLVLNEVSRLVAQDGVAVIRETVTPKKAWRTLTDKVLEGSGFQEAARYTQDSSLWQGIELSYGELSHKLFALDRPRPQNFYLFLTKTATS